MKFYLGTHRPYWLRDERFIDVPLFVSDRTLKRYKNLPRAVTTWSCDSGGFTELSTYGEWKTKAHNYAARVRRYLDNVGGLEWAAPQDWMCEPFILEKTKKTVHEHQQLSVRSVLDLRTLTQDIHWIPVLQGWTRDDYQRHWQMYEQAGFDLENEAVVGLGSVCRRQGTVEAQDIVRSLKPLRIHGFGMKSTAIKQFGEHLHSSDSMAWSYGGRKRPDPNCPKNACNNCEHRALEYFEKVKSYTKQPIRAL